MQNYFYEKSHIWPILSGIDLGHGEPEWIVTKERSKWDAIFQSLGPVKGKITGSVAKKEMIKSRLPNPVLAKVERIRLDGGWFVKIH